MENRRFILIALLCVALFFLYQAWQADYAAKKPVAGATAEVAPATAVETPVTDSDAPQAVTAPATETLSLAPRNDAGIGVVTDVMSVEIGLRGGEIRRLELLGYPLSKKDPAKPLPLMNDRDGQFFIVQSGLAGTQQPYASGETLFAASQSEYRLKEGESGVEVVLESQGEAGVKVRKTYRFARGSYRVELDQTLVNLSADSLTVSPYAKLVRNSTVAGEVPKFVSTFLGVGFYEKKDGSENFRFVKTKLEKLGEEPIEKRQSGGWISMLQHYFVAAILPPQAAEGVYSARAAKEGTFAAQYVATGTVVAPGAQQSFPLSFYLGPKLQSGLTVGSEGSRGWFKDKGLDTVARGLDYTIDYGILTPICEPLFWLLNKFHGFTGNWGAAIILLTLVVKAIFYKLSEAQYRSMAKMKKFAPRIQDLKERYGHDRERMSKAMMELYKKEGFNPLAGCWPLLVQFPVFIALYWVLLESVELRQADLALWINDLSAPDPYYVLPVLFGITFFVQQKWSGSTATMDPTQQKIMNVMPIMMTAFFAFFQAGLVLYWLVSNLIGMAQQWLINRKLEGEGLGKAKTA